MKKHIDTSRIAQPREVVGKGTYMGVRQTPLRPGTEVFDKIPSRMGDTLHYRDGTTEEVK